MRADPWRAPPVDRLTLNNVVAVRANPLGLEDQLRVVYQRRLYAHDSAVLRDNFLAVGLFPKLSPACLRVGPIVEVQPLSMLNVRATAEWAWFPRSFNYLQSFSSPTADFSDATLRARHDAGDDYSTTAFHATIEPTVQAKLGPIAIRNRLGLDYWDASLTPGPGSSTRGSRTPCCRTRAGRSRMTSICSTSREGRSSSAPATP